MSKRKPFNDCAGYVASLRSGPQGGYVVIYDAAAQGLDASAGRYATSCETHYTLVNTTSVPKARAAMKDPASFCDGCREAGVKPYKSGPERDAETRALPVTKRESLGFGFVLLASPRPGATLAERDVAAELAALGVRHGLEFVADGKNVGRLLGIPGRRLAYGGLPVGEKLRSNALLPPEVQLMSSGIPDLLVTADGTRAPLSKLDGGSPWVGTVGDALKSAPEGTVVIGADVYRVR